MRCQKFRLKMDFTTKWSSFLGPKSVKKVFLFSILLLLPPVIWALQTWQVCALLLGVHRSRTATITPSPNNNNTEILSWIFHYYIIQIWPWVVYGLHVIRCYLYYFRKPTHHRCTGYLPSRHLKFFVLSLSVLHTFSSTFLLKK